MWFKVVFKPPRSKAMPAQSAALTPALASLRLDHGAARGERRGPDLAGSGGDAGERQGSAGRPRAGAGAKAHGKAERRGGRGQGHGVGR